MLKPRKMSRLLIVASKEQMAPIIREVYSHRIFHIKDHVEEKGGEFAELSIGKPLPGASEASERLVKIRSIESIVGVNPEDLQPKRRHSVQELRAAIDRDLARIADEVEGLLQERSGLEAELRDREQQMKELEPFAAVPIPLELYRGYATLAVFTGRVPRDVNIDVPHEKYFSARKEGNFIALFVPKEHQSAAEQALLAAGFAPLPVPKGEGMPERLLDAHRQEISRITAGIARVEERLQRIRTEQMEFLAASEEILTADVEQASAPLRFATTDQAFIAEGWVPTEEVPRLKSGISLATDGRVYISDQPVGMHDPAPVEYDNPAFARPAQALIDLYSRPRYNELDPTLLVAIIFPIFFGLILGDVGYGAILLVVALALRRFLTSPDGRRLLTVLLYASITSIIFGVLFSEFFGFAIPGVEPLLPSRHLSIGAEAHGAGPDLTGLLMLVVWIGIFQITLGRSLNAYIQYHHHGTRGLTGQVGWIAVMWGILVILWSLFPLPMMPDLTASPPVVMGLSLPGIVGAVLLVLGVVGIAMESALEIVELPTIISHTLSYARLAAVGLSSVAIAMVVNLIAIGMIIEPQLENLSAAGIVFIILGVVVLVIGHLGNTALGLIGGGLQSLRLQYVEFFTKFYRGGGIKYNPFGLLRRFTED
ncbi:MAG: V-type ATP synthase subunit I [Methanomicrobiales archaeon]|nr:V-type ATP synthase subunit I [Methanomicrobiales archaeon]